MMAATQETLPLNCSWTRVSEVCAAVENQANADIDDDTVQIDIQFSQAKFDMSSFIGGIILVLCVQAGGFFAMRFLKAKEQSTYDPIPVCLHTESSHSEDEMCEGQTDEGGGEQSRMEEKQADSSLDLSHLTEDEQTTILQVLQRDSELRRLDEGRVRNLQEKEKDPVRLRYLVWGMVPRAVQKTPPHLVSQRSRPLPPYATGRQRPEACGSVFVLLWGYPSDGFVVLAMVTDVPLTGLFNGETEETSHNNNTLPEAERRLKDSKDDESGGLLSGSMMSLFSSGDFGLVEVRGRIQFSLVYDTQKEELHVKVFCCEDIAAARKNRSDPYVKTYLLPDKSSQSKKKTSVKKKTLNPVYDQTLRYKLHIGELRSRTLNMSVWHAEHLGRNVFLGEVEVSLGLWDWTYTQPLWQDLQPRVHLSPESISCRGTIVLSIKFIPDGFEGGGLPLTGELHIWLREAKGLLTTKGGPVDSFVRSYILP
ncbi:Synaptotagmin-like protein 1 [Larimichthys crocea]|uniref:Uncharacterized protein n=1 Tax=Larimichthys crocea TaxID=215358 RepID=A0ACD3RF75_LARCR|nr:Synaptotagmin-like protein 1 [Larimichthys crocea]